MSKRGSCPHPPIILSTDAEAGFVGFPEREAVNVCLQHVKT